MQFFEHQDQARGRTTLLLLLFGLSVIGLGAASATATHYVLLSEVRPGEELTGNHWNWVATAGIATFGIILLGSAYRLAQLSGGGTKIAESLGGTLVCNSTTDLLERRVVNIVEEMAIASGLPVPPVYVMRGEPGINAFAAGWSPDDAVIGVTTGALESLSRDQLQGVIAHEFSHILNRDCALNMRLIGILHGIIVISLIGRLLISLGSGSRHRSSKSDGAFQFVIVGAVVWVFGSIGILIARAIQAAVSRQREFLADASAVQFTRNPQGIAGALATIATQTSAITSPHGGETSHMLIAEPGKMGLLGNLASHPPLFERIGRILPTWGGEFDALATKPGSVRASLEQESHQQKQKIDGAAIAQEMMLGGGMAPQIPGVPQSAQAVLGGALILESVGSNGASTTQPTPAQPTPAQPTPTRPTAGQSPTSPTPAAQTPSSASQPAPQAEPTAHASPAPQAPLSHAAQILASIPSALRHAAEDPYSTRALVFAWILDHDPDVHNTQLALLSSDAPLAAETERLYKLMPSLAQKAILPLFDIAVGSLAPLSERQKDEFLRLLQALEAQLQPQSYRSFCLAALAIRHLDPRGKKHKIKPLLIKQAIETMLGVLAVRGHDTASDAEAAFASGRRQLGKRGTNLKLPTPTQLNIHALKAAFATLLRLPNTTRAQLLNAAEFVAAHDGEVRASEAELLRVMASCLGIAMPPAFAT